VSLGSKSLPLEERNSTFTSADAHANHDVRL
jgi:hypothetical protein